MSARLRVVAIVGATATGKTALAEGLAARLEGEVVCADSRQLFRDLETGTGKPSPEQRAARPHHLFEALSLEQRASAGGYAAAAASVCRQIDARGQAIVLVGGSGLYLRALRTGLSAEPLHDPEVRARLRGELAQLGPAALHDRLAACDPVTAARLAPRDSQRITRALEVFESSGRPLSWWHAHAPGPDPALDAEWVTIELVLPAEALAERIAERTRGMFDAGLIEETRALLDRGLGDPLRKLRAIGYDEAIALLERRVTHAEAVERTTLRTRQLAKRQRTWFRHQVEATRLEVAGLEPERLIERALDAASKRH